MARGLDADTLKVVAQNKALSEELHFQREMSEDLKHKESKWKALATEARRDVELLRESEKERAAIAVRKTKEAKAREERITALESQLKELRKSTQRTRPVNCDGIWKTRSRSRRSTRRVCGRWCASSRRSCPSYGRPRRRSSSSARRSSNFS